MSLGTWGRVAQRRKRKALQKLVVIVLLAMLTVGCGSDSDKTGGSGGSGGSGAGGAGGSAAGGTGGSSGVSCADWCAHFYQDLHCDTAGADTCNADCEADKQSGDFLLAEAQCQVAAADCSAWDTCATQN